MDVAEISTFIVFMRGGVSCKGDSSRFAPLLAVVGVAAKLEWRLKHVSIEGVEMRQVTIDVPLLYDHAQIFFAVTILGVPIH